MTICLSSILLNLYFSPVEDFQQSGKAIDFNFPSFFRGILGCRLQTVFIIMYPAKQYPPLMVINPSIILVKVTLSLYRFSNTIDRTNKEKENVDPYITNQHLLIRHFSFFFSASLRSTSAMISRRHCLLLFFFCSIILPIFPILLLLISAHQIIYCPLWADRC